MSNTLNQSNTDGSPALAGDAGSESETQSGRVIRENENAPDSRTNNAVVRESIISLLLDAQSVIADLPMGGIGGDGPTQSDIDEAEESGRPIGDDACYHQGQKAWLILERAKALLTDIVVRDVPLGGRSL